MTLLDASVSSQCPDMSGTLRADTSPDVQPKWIQKHPPLSWQRSSYLGHRILVSYLYGCSTNKRNQMLCLTHRVLSASLVLESFLLGEALYSSQALMASVISKSVQTLPSQKQLPWCQGKPDPGLLIDSLDVPGWAELTVHMAEISSVTYFCC